jgi:hypothetical protein
VEENTMRGDATSLGAVWQGSYSYRSASVDGFFTAVPFLEDPETGDVRLNPQRLYFSFPRIPGWSAVTQESFDPELTWLRVADGGRVVSFFAGFGGNTQLEFSVNGNTGAWFVVMPDEPPFGRAGGRLDFSAPQTTAVPESGALVFASGLMFFVLRSAVRRARVMAWGRGRPVTRTAWRGTQQEAGVPDRLDGDR